MRHSSVGPFAELRPSAGSRFGKPGPGPIYRDRGRSARRRSLARRVSRAAVSPREACRRVRGPGMFTGAAGSSPASDRRAGLAAERSARRVTESNHQRMGYRAGETPAARCVPFIACSEIAGIGGDSAHQPSHCSQVTAAKSLQPSHCSASANRYESSALGRAKARSTSFAILSGSVELLAILLPTLPVHPAAAADGSATAAANGRSAISPRQVQLVEPAPGKAIGPGNRYQGQ